MTYASPPGPLYSPIAMQPPPIAGQIVVHGLVKQFKQVKAVDSLSFTVQPGTVTGFLGPNGAGKTTTLRMLLGLVRPTAGFATIGGLRYEQLHNPLSIVGASLESSSFHPGRSGADHLKVLCTAANIPLFRVDQVLAQVGMSVAAKRRVKQYSLGMRQRLALAAALIGDPQVLVLDEPANGLDPEGINWLRGFLRSLAAQGRTVLVSSHLLSEIEKSVDDVVIISQGRSVMQGKIADLVAQQRSRVKVRTRDVARLQEKLKADSPHLYLETPAADTLYVYDAQSSAISKIALELNIEVEELTTERPSLEQLFLSLTSNQGFIA